MSNRLTIHPKSIFILTSGILITTIVTFLSVFTLSKYDNQISKYFQKFHGSPTDNQIMIFITNLASWQIVLFAFVLLSIILLLKRHYYYLISFFISIFFGQAFILLIKYITARPRPSYTSALVYEPTFSFPSGHTFLAFSFYGLLAYYLFEICKNIIIRSIVLFSTISILLLVALSRIYLGAHWPTDVIASFIIGIFWITTIIVVNELHQEHIKKISKSMINSHYINILSIFFIFVFEMFSIIFYMYTIK